MSRWEATLAQQIQVLGLPEPAREYKFHESRRWRFDFAFVAQRVACEVEGVTYFGKHLGRHQTRKGVAADAEKYNTAALAGWCVLRFTPDMIASGDAARTVERALKLKRSA